MKKFLSLIITLIVIANLQVFASDIDVLATINSRSTSPDRVWVGTFQLAWNDLIDKVVHTIIRFREGNPTIVK